MGGVKMKEPKLRHNIKINQDNENDYKKLFEYNLEGNENL